MTTKEPLKDLHSQHPVPVVWRDTYSEIVERFVDGDYGLERSVQHVLPISEETAAQISGYIADYGETLVHSPLCSRRSEQRTMEKHLSNLTNQSGIRRFLNGWAIAGKYLLTYVPNRKGSAT